MLKYNPSLWVLETHESRAFVPRTEPDSCAVCNSWHVGGPLIAVVAVYMCSLLVVMYSGRSGCDDNDPAVIALGMLIGMTSACILSYFTGVIGRSLLDDVLK